MNVLVNIYFAEDKLGFHFFDFLIFLSSSQIMQKTNEDCFYFLTSTCAKVSDRFQLDDYWNYFSVLKGLACTYRHHPTARTCNVICQAWSRGNCTDPVCSLRHSNIQVNLVNE